MSISRIEFDYREALRQADRLDEAARGIKRLTSNDMENTLDTLSHGWQGESASAFVSKGRQLKEKTALTASDLTNAAAKIRSVAKRIHDAEKAALEIAARRSY